MTVTRRRSSARPPQAPPELRTWARPPVLVASLLISFSLLGAGCDSERTSAPDELTIVVRGDRRELELKEQALEQREASLGSEKEKLDQRIAELSKNLDAAGKSLSAADLGQRRRFEEELARARLAQKETSLKFETLRAQKNEVGALKTAIDPPLAQAQSAVLAAREAAVALREARTNESEQVASRRAQAADAEIKKREQAVAAREQEVAAREQGVAAREQEAARLAAVLGKGEVRLPGLRDVPRAQAVEQKHKKLLDDLDARGILVVDLAAEDQPLNAEIWAARRLGDFARAGDLVADLGKALRSLKIDRTFVEAKMVRLQAVRAQAKIGEAQKRDVERLLHEVTSAYSDGRYEQANRGLNQIARILDASGAPG